MTILDKAITLSNAATYSSKVGTRAPSAAKKSQNYPSIKAVVICKAIIASKHKRESDK